MIDERRLQRFLRDDREVRLGNLASDLLRLSTWVSQRKPDEAVRTLMTEIASLLECVGEPTSEEIADVQREVCRWRLLWPLEEARSLLAFRARVMSQQLLDLSGLAANLQDC